MRDVPAQSRRERRHLSNQRQKSVWGLLKIENEQEELTDRVQVSQRVRQLLVELSTVRTLQLLDVVLDRPLTQHLRPSINRASSSDLFGVSQSSLDPFDDRLGRCDVVRSESSIAKGTGSLSGRRVAIDGEESPDILEQRSEGSVPELVQARLVHARVEFSAQLLEVVEFSLGGRRLRQGCLEDVEDDLLRVKEADQGGGVSVATFVRTGEGGEGRTWLAFASSLNEPHRPLSLGRGCAFCHPPDEYE